MSDVIIKDNLIIIDSPSDCGKTSLCWHLINKYKCNYYHSKRWNKPGIDYNNHILNLVFDDIEKYHSNWIIERLHLSELAESLYTDSELNYDIKKYNDDIIQACNEKSIKYSLITCLPPKTDDMNSKMYDSFLEVYNQNKDSMNIYNYDYTDDSDYNNFDSYLEDLQA